MKSAQAQIEVVATLPTCHFGLRLAADGKIAELAFVAPEIPLAVQRSPAGECVANWLAIWLENPAAVLEWPQAKSGTPFQRRVWAAIRTIPAGQTRRYGELAQSLGSVPRAVGQACGANPFPLLTPCHRVLAQNGHGGFAHADSGWLIDTKLWLLRHEALEPARLTG